MLKRRVSETKQPHAKYGSCLDWIQTYQRKRIFLRQAGRLKYGLLQNTKELVFIFFHCDKHIKRTKVTACSIQLGGMKHSHSITRPSPRPVPDICVTPTGDGPHPRPLPPPSPAITFYVSTDLPIRNISHKHHITYKMWPFVTSFLYIPWFPGPSTLWIFISISFFLWLRYSIVWIDRILFICSCVDEHLSCFRLSERLNSTAVNIHVELFMWTPVSNPLGCIRRSEIAGSQGASVYLTQKLCSRRGCPVSHSGQHFHTRGPVSPHPRQRWPPSLVFCF